MLDYDFLIKPLLIALAAALIGGTSFVGGCEYQKDKQTKKDIAEVTANARVEKKDTASGVVAVQNFKQTEASYQQGFADAVKKAAGKPLVIVKSNPASCPQQAVESKNLETPKEPVNESAETDIAYFSPDFMQLYDSTAQPGNAVLRTRTYAATEAIKVDEGSRIIAENNQSCAGYSAQLDALISRIQEKQKLFNQPERQ